MADFDENDAEMLYDVLSVRAETIATLLMSADTLQDPKLKELACRAAEMVLARMEKPKPKPELVAFPGGKVETAPFSKGNQDREEN